MRIWKYRTVVNRAITQAVRCCAEALESRTLLAGLSIAAENQLPGSPASEWDIDGAGDSTLQGFATDISVNQGQTVTFKIDDQDRASYHIDIYRMGYYGGLGARKVATIGSLRTNPQPAPRTDPETQLVDCGNWLPSTSWNVPSDATSGIYFAKLIRDDTGGASHIYFVVRNDTDHSAVLFKTSDTTWQAYNDWGGAFIEAPANRAYKASYNRPFNTRSHNDGYGSWNFIFHAEYPMVRWLEFNGYDVSYFTSVDADRYGSLIQDHKVFLSVGHDEYWSGQERASVEAARDAGVNLAFFSGNEMYRKIRWETSIDGSGTPYRTMVCYKETNDNGPSDPADPPIWTGTWRDPRFSPPADGGRPENAVSGQLFTVCVGADELGTTFKVPANYSKLRFWRNTSVASLGANQTATLGDHVLGYEWDEDVDNGWRPAGLFQMSSTTTAVQGRLIGENIAIGVDVYPAGTATHTLTLYRASSGALVFGAGTVQWSWGLDGQHDNGSYAPDRNVQQATVNLLADMGVQPATLQSGLVKATASTDFTRPTSAITSPANGATFQPDTPITITGTASDGGGGVVAAVEISVDGGSTWHPLTGRATWSYTWTPHQGGTITIKSRAVDDSGNLETPSAGITLTGQGQTPSGTSIWSDTAVPAVASDSDTSSVELGVKFRSDAAGSIRGIRFYKGSQNTGTHVGSLWSQTGTLLAQATFINETSSGWQSVLFSAPVTITANTTYVASYHAGSGHYSVDEGYFAVSGMDSSPLHALANGADGPNGVYRYGSNSVFPTDSYQSSNYWVDVLFASGADTQAPTVTGRAPSSGATSVPITTTVTATFSEPVQSNSISFVLRDANNNLVPATLTYNSGSNTATLTPTAALAGSSTYTATVSGAKDSAGNTMAGSVSWSFTTVAVDTTPPTVAAQTPALNATNVPVNTTVTVTFSEAVDSTTVNATDFQLKNGSTVIVASVSYNSSTRVATLTPSTLLAGSTIYTATVAGVKDLAGNVLTPAASWSFTTAAVDTTPPTVTGQTPAPSATNVPIGTTVTVTFSEAIDTTTLTTTNCQLKNGTTVVPASMSYDAITRTATLTPSNPLAGSTIYTATVSGIKDLAGNIMMGIASWSFTTAAIVDTTPPGVTAQTPAANATNVPVATTVTVTFNEAVDAATVTGASFQLKNGSTVVPANITYNAATRIATLTPTTLLASLTTYTASVSGVKDLAGNTMTGSVSWSFTTVAVDTTPPAVTSQTPAANATGVAIATSVTATFSESVQSASIAFVLRDSTGNTVLANVTYSDSTRTATLTPNSPLAYSTTYTATLSGASDLAGNVMTSPANWSFTTVAAPASGTFNLWSNTTIPTIAADSDSAAVELGVKFRASVDGYITGIRFYKGSSNTGTHTGSLWNRSGTRLATVTFINETSSGWQTVSFASPVFISANTTYVASYHTNVGHYAVDEGYFADSGSDSGPLHALSDGEDGPNGLYRYGSTSGFPNSAYNSSNYWVDVVFSPAIADTVAPTVAGYSPTADAAGVPITTTVAATFSESVQPSSIAFVLRDAGGNAVPVAVTYVDATRTATLTPTAPLAGDVIYTATVAGALDLAGNSLAGPTTWSFTTAGGWTQTSASDFATGSATGVFAANNAGGELQLMPTFADEFSGNALGSAWSSSVWSSGTGTAAVAETGGILSIGRMQVLSVQALTNTAIEGRIALAAARGQQFGLATSLLTTSGNYSAVFTTKSTTTTLYARVNNGGTLRDVSLGAIPTGFHVYRVEPIATGFRFYIDGVLKTTITRTIPAGTQLKVAFAAQDATPVLQADWVHGASYVSAGTFISSVYDAGRSVSWQSAAWTAGLPAGTHLSVEISTGNTANPGDGTWSAWTAVGNGSPIAGHVARYLQYRLQFTTDNSAQTPTVFDISFAWN